MSFFDVITRYDWDTTRRRIYASTPADVERALMADRPTMEQFAALVSPAADAYLDTMAAKSYRTTRRKFGNSICLSTWPTSVRTTASTVVSTVPTRFTVPSSLPTRSAKSVTPSRAIRLNTSCW